ncbi:hypothetical protein [Aquibacillus rhizosphaerae]|uniref:Uncharacterized protein n=1 Tax=Aquibacillus rhizosphaerae TaxID=3051431 RepID=A0ABT7LCL6_9BACI|nr:hypothetical protein [Aquibacillus sp. LR5S19]MDL4842915.1 hypothetical protein [Aquibacillus sp. LR5S19]
MPDKTDSKNQSVNPFDQLMFGQRPPRQSISSKQNQDEALENNEEEQSFDLFNTAQTMAETYKQLSPYVKGISGMFKKFKS